MISASTVFQTFFRGAGNGVGYWDFESVTFEFNYFEVKEVRTMCLRSDSYV